MSISTSASSAASGMRLYAVRSALASASSMISIEMPFSRSMFSSASIISEFIDRATSFVASLIRLARPLENGARLHDVVVGDALGRAGVEPHVAAVVVGVGQHAADPPRRSSPART